MVILKAHAKINLFFHITGKRDDGYHLIDSLVTFSPTLYDIIAISPSDENKVLIQDGEFASLLHGQDNLIDTALHLFTQDKYQCTLTKNIPIGAGLGGGSSDAAIVAKFLDPNLSNEKLMQIGADLPICYYGKPSFCSGIGEIIEPVANFPEIYLLLVNPKKTLLTKDVFRQYQSNYHPMIERCNFNNTEELIDFLLPLRNDLTEAAIELLPEILEILDLLTQQDGCRIARMSGSGPTCFGIFTDKLKALEASKNIASISKYWVSI